MSARCDLLCFDLPRAEAARDALPGEDEARILADRARALADPTRLLLGLALEEAGELCVCDLAWIAGRPENLVSHHLRVLRAGGVVTSRRDGRMVLYAVTGSGRALLAAVRGRVGVRT